MPGKQGNSLWKLPVYGSRKEGWSAGQRRHKIISQIHQAVVQTFVSAHSPNLYVEILTCNGMASEDGPFRR